MLLSTLLFPAIIDGPYLHSFCLWDYHSPLPSPKPPDRRDGEITLSLGGPKVIICEEFVERELCELAVTATSAVASVSTEAGEVKFFCDCSFVLLESVMCYWEMPPGKREKKMSIKPNLSPHLHGTSPFIFFFFLFFYLVLISGSTCT